MIHADIGTRSFPRMTGLARSARRVIAACGIAACACVAIDAQAVTAASSERAVRDPAGDPTDRIIVKLKAAYRDARTTGRVAPMSVARADALATVAGIALRPVRAMSGDSQVVALPSAMKAADVAAIVARLRNDPSVELADVDARERLMAIPNDPLFNQQSYLQAPAASPRAAGVNAPGAWDITQGTGSAVIAILDGGARFDHPDLAGRLINGYDFVSEDCMLGTTGCTASIAYTSANDGDGRDPDASDPGDWVSAADKATNPILANCEVEDSVWHGTHIAGIVGAAGNNGLGITGLNWNASLLIVRVSGRCGAYRSDVIDAMRWAAGLAVPNVPTNPRPARVINLSLGSAGTCSGSSYAPAIADLQAAGAMLVAAAGNEDGDVIQPANCTGVIAVGAVRGDGQRASYSNSGPNITIMAPGGDYLSAVNDRLLSTSNSGRTTPVAYSSAGVYDSLAGTSFSTPVVTGVVSLMLSINPNLTTAQVTDALRSTARPFVQVSGVAACVPGGLKAPAGSQRACNCTTAACGPGTVDAAAAVARAQTLAAPPTAPTTPTTPTTPAAPASGGGGGGGGGAIDPVALLVLGALAVATRKLHARRATKPANDQHA